TQGCCPPPPFARCRRWAQRCRRRSAATWSSAVPTPTAGRIFRLTNRGRRRLLRSFGRQLCLTRWCSRPEPPIQREFVVQPQRDVGRQRLAQTPTVVQSITSSIDQGSPASRDDSSLAPPAPPCGHTPRR